MSPSIGFEIPTDIPPDHWMDVQNGLPVILAISGGRLPLGMAWTYNVAMLVVLGIFGLLFLPRAVAGVLARSGFSKGFLIQSKPALNPFPSGTLTTSQSLALSTSRLSHPSSDGSHTLHGTEGGWSSSTIDLVKEKLKTAQAYRPPPHIPSWGTILYPVSAVLSRPLFWGIQPDMIIYFSAYLAGYIITARIYSSPIALATQFPALFALAAKNNIPGLLLGIGYEKLNILHRWIGVVFIIAGNVHSYDYIIRWAKEGTFQAELLTMAPRWGFAAFACLNFLALFSIPVIRKRFYNVFLVTHIFGFIGLGFTTVLHFRISKNFIIAACAIFVFDHIVRLVKTRVATANIRTVPELGITLIEIPSLNSGWRAGQHVRLRVLSRELGLYGWAESHPFTIASAATRNGTSQGLTLMCKRVGRWTWDLYNTADKKPETPEGGVSLSSTRKVLVQIEGPYGGLGHMELSTYSAALLVVAGSGVTFGFSTVEELLQNALDGRSRCRFITLVWVVRDRATFTAFMPMLLALQQRGEAIPGSILKIALHYTQKQMPPTTDNTNAEKTQELGLSGLIECKSGRPDIPAILDGIITITSGLPTKKGIAVGVCGPTSLGEQVARNVKAVSRTKNASVGGIELHSEIFGW